MYRSELFDSQQISYARRCAHLIELLHGVIGAFEKLLSHMGANGIWHLVLQNKIAAQRKTPLKYCWEKDTTFTGKGLACSRQAPKSLWSSGSSCRAVSGRPRETRAQGKAK